jgi:hypothetical protein
MQPPTRPLSPTFCKPGSPCFEIPTLVGPTVAAPAIRAAMRILAGAVAPLGAGLVPQTRDTVERLPLEQAAPVRGRSQETACDHHTVPEVDLSERNRADGAPLGGEDGGPAPLCRSTIRPSRKDLPQSSSFMTLLRLRSARYRRQQLLGGQDWRPPPSAYWNCATHRI